MAEMEARPGTGRQDWWHQGPCATFYAQTGYDAWYGPNDDEMALIARTGGLDEARKARREARRIAKQICAKCPIQIRAECLTWALEHPEEEGVWGGLDMGERTKLRNRLAATAA